jgi:hypothetical protein
VATLNGFSDFGVYGGRAVLIWFVKNKSVGAARLGDDFTVLCSPPALAQPAAYMDKTSISLLSLGVSGRGR